MKRTTLRAATELLNEIRAAGYAVTEYADAPGIFTTSFSNPYSRASTAICVHFRRPPAGCSGRQSAAVITTVHDARGLKDRSHRGTWDARYALRQHAADVASYARNMAALHRGESLDSAAL